MSDDGGLTDSDAPDFVSDDEVVVDGAAEAATAAGPIGSPDAPGWDCDSGTLVTPGDPYRLSLPWDSLMTATTFEAAPIYGTWAVDFLRDGTMVCINLVTKEFGQLSGVSSADIVESEEDPYNAVLAYVKDNVPKIKDVESMSAFEPACNAVSTGSNGTTSGRSTIWGA